jgi:hypothetical protein
MLFLDKSPLLAWIAAAQNVISPKKRPLNMKILSAGVCLFLSTCLFSQNPSVHEVGFPQGGVRTALSRP